MDMLRPASVSLLCFGLLRSTLFVSLANVLRLRSVSPIRRIRSDVFGQPVFGQSTVYRLIRNTLEQHRNKAISFHCDTPKCLRNQVSGKNEAGSAFYTRWES